MLDDAALMDLFRACESDRVERKARFDKNQTAEAIRQAICAFANDLPGHGQPGVIFIGHNDDGTCAGAQIDDRLLQTLGAMRSDGKIMPMPVMTVQRHVLDGCALAVITVMPSTEPPVRLDGRVWVRIGPRTEQASRDDERRLTEKQQWQNVPFDQQPCADAGRGDLDLAYFAQDYLPSAVSREVLRENGRTPDEQLRALRLLRPDGRPTNAAMLLLGRDPRGFLPGAYIQFLRIDGTELTDPIRDQKELSGRIADQLRALEVLLKLNITTRTRIGGEKRTERPDYPLAALEQLARNLVLHRTYQTHAPGRVHWYDDRIEFLSPGGLYGMVNDRTIWQGSTDYRNPALAAGMKDLGLVERFGFGLATVKKSLAETGHPPLDADFQPQHVLFTVRGGVS